MLFVFIWGNLETTIAIENNGTWDFFLDGKIGRPDETGAIIVNNGTAGKTDRYNVQLVDGVYILVHE